MNTLSANQAKTNFGSLLFDVQHSPVQINKNGKPVAVVMSIDEYQQIEEFKIQLLKMRAKQAQIETEKNQLVDGEEFFDELLAGHYD
ncbi:antitoxin [Pasteurellaceae bacterium 15-036681]|nr:antitoxin [Pasteurellaceae bacterium 15-036681]